MKKIGQVLKMVRTGKNVTQDALAERLGVTGSYISALELGKRDMSWSTLEGICEVLDVSLGLVVLVSQDDDEECKPFVHSAYAMLWQQIRVPF